jgi:hypothetical protein
MMENIMCVGVVEGNALENLNMVFRAMVTTTLSYVESRGDAALRLPTVNFTVPTNSFPHGATTSSTHAAQDVLGVASRV